MGKEGGVAGEDTTAPPRKGDREQSRDEEIPERKEMGIFLRGCEVGVILILLVRG